MENSQRFLSQPQSTAGRGAFSTAEQALRKRALKAVSGEIEPSRQAAFFKALSIPDRRYEQGMKSVSQTARMLGQEEQGRLEAELRSDYESSLEAALKNYLPSFWKKCNISDFFSTITSTPIIMTSFLLFSQSLHKVYDRFVKNDLTAAIMAVGTFVLAAAINIISKAILERQQETLGSMVSIAREKEDG